MNPQASCFQHSAQEFPMYGAMEDVLSSPMSASGAVTGAAGANYAALLSCLSVLRDRVQQMESVMGLLLSAGHHVNEDSASMAVAGAGALIQEIIVTASSMMFSFQQLALDAGVVADHGGGLPRAAAVAAVDHDGGDPDDKQASCNFGRQAQGGYSAHAAAAAVDGADGEVGQPREVRAGAGAGACDGIVEMDAADLLAKYTHYCHVCGKGFKRDANLRMHMRAHGDEYKTSAALSNPAKSGGGQEEWASESPRKYSCPQEGCRWNRRHPRFQPLKSMVCVKNHYRRSHCPKMYVCSRCRKKQFSVLSDLRTHEKHCGDLRWRCSCGTTFSRKDKLMGHVALFVGHAPAAGCPTGRRSSAGHGAKA